MCQDVPSYWKMLVESYRASCSREAHVEQLWKDMVTFAEQHWAAAGCLGRTYCNSTNCTQSFQMLGPHSSVGCLQKQQFPSIQLECCNKIEKDHLLDAHRMERWWILDMAKFQHKHPTHFRGPFDILLTCQLETCPFDAAWPWDPPQLHKDNLRAQKCGRRPTGTVGWQTRDVLDRVCRVWLINSDIFSLF